MGSLRIARWTPLLLLPFAVGGGQPARAEPAPTVEEARKFIESAEARLLPLGVDAERAAWVHSTYITSDTETLAAEADERSIAAAVELAKQATRFDHLNLPADLSRKLRLLKNSFTLATPADRQESQELTRIVSQMEGAYGSGKYCPQPGRCLDLEELSNVLRDSRNRAEILDAWRGWASIAVPIRAPFRRYVELSNKGARELGFADTGAMWRSKYDMPPEEFAKELDRLWNQVRPLYVSLHAYVRARLRQHYGEGVVPAKGPIPADLLGNMWAQEWENVYPLVAPRDDASGYNLTEILRARNTQPKAMVRYGESFFTSLGFQPLPETFWQRSLFVKPRDRDVVCHASAWDVDMVDDVRLKMCIEINAEDFSTVHHELGHNFYQRAYNRQPLFFRTSANDGFHEAIGDTIALSVTPQYLVKLGFLKQAPDPSKDIGLLLRKALEKVAFLPFGLLIDQWRWKVFSGEITPEHYNEGWWNLRLKYQGVAPPTQRSEADFDPGAKYHVAANTPYARYFLADILQFQFHRALVQVAGCREPLNRCSIYDSKPAGKRLNAMLEMGASKPWQDALEVVTGQRQMDATAMLEYFAPLQKWLDEQNRGNPTGW